MDGKIALKIDVKNTGTWKLDTRRWKMEAGNLKLDPRTGKMNAGSWKIDTGSCKMVTGSHYLVRCLPVSGETCCILPDTRGHPWAQYIRSGPEGARGVLKV